MKSWPQSTSCLTARIFDVDDMRPGRQDDSRPRLAHWGQLNLRPTKPVMLHTLRVVAHRTLKLVRARPFDIGRAGKRLCRRQHAAHTGNRRSSRVPGLRRPDRVVRQVGLRQPHLVPRPDGHGRYAGSGGQRGCRLGHMGDRARADRLARPFVNPPPHSWGGSRDAEISNLHATSVS